MSLLDPDINMTKRFLALLHAGFTEEFFMTFHEKKQQRVIAKIGPFDEFQPYLKDRNQRGHGIFFAINRTDGSGVRNKSTITEAMALFLDLDGSPVEPVFQCEIEPSLVVETSPGKFHCYWCLRNFPLADYESYQSYLADRFGGDRSVKDVCRLARLPGFYHQKDQPFMTRVVGGALWD